jgi:hypothetical protein
MQNAWELRNAQKMFPEKFEGKIPLADKLVIHGGVVLKQVISIGGGGKLWIRFI